MIRRGEPGFDDARIGRVFNARRPDRQPDAVLCARSVEDVRAGVLLARERGWRVAVRSGGHSWAAWSVREDGLLIDLGGLADVEYDEPAGIVRVGPAVRGGDLNDRLVPRGVFFPGGHCPTVGLGGFLLQGGMGWNCRGWGWACERIVALDVVTAEGDLVRADANTNTDLFWAARGAGPGFPGIVVRFHLAVRDHPRTLTQSTLVHPVEAAEEILHWAQAIAAELADTVEFVVLGLTPPDSPDPVIVVHGVAFEDDVLAPLSTCPGTPLARELDQPTSLAAENVEQERQNTQGNRFAVDNIWSSAPPTSPLVDLFTTLPSRDSYTLWYAMAPLRDLPDMALSLQSPNYVASYVSWPDPVEDAHCRDWLARRMRALEPVTDGQYLGDSDFTVRQLRFLGDPQWTRLRAVQQDRDPDHRFAGFLSPTPVTNRNHWEDSAHGTA